MLLYFAMTPNMGLGSSGIDVEGVAQGREVDWPCYATHDIVFAGCLLRA